MPTTRRRHSITETDEIAAALAKAANTWPEVRNNPAALLRLLVLTGSRSLDEGLAARLAALDELAGSMPNVYEPGYLDTLRQDWPA